jgi:hypothetical protein
MDKSKLIWGIVCLVIAVGLALANLLLPPDSLMFQVGDRNMPWVPPVVLGIVGIVLLATVRESEPASEPPAQPLPGQDPEKAALNKRLESVAWGLFLIMLGGFALVPRETIPGGVWSLGVGLIMLGLNAARYYYRIRMSGFTTVIGILSVLGGLAELAGLTSLEGGLLLIILGAYLLLKPWFDKHQLFGRAEHSRP